MSAPIGTMKNMQKTVRKQQAMAKNATALEQAKAIFSSTPCLSASDTDVDSSDDLELYSTSISTDHESKVVEKCQKGSNILLTQLNQHKELIATLQKQLQQKDTCKPCMYTL